MTESSSTTARELCEVASLDQALVLLAPKIDTRGKLNRVVSIAKKILHIYAYCCGYEEGFQHKAAAIYTFRIFLTP